MPRGPHPRGSRVGTRSARPALGLKAPLGEDGRTPAALRLRRGRFLPAGLAPLAQGADELLGTLLDLSYLLIGFRSRLRVSVVDLPLALFQRLLAEGPGHLAHVSALTTAAAADVAHA